MHVGRRDVHDDRWRADRDRVAQLAGRHRHDTERTPKCVPSSSSSETSWRSRWWRRCRRSPPSRRLPTATTTTSGGEPRLIGRAVLPADTLAEGPPSGAAIASANGITFPLPSQPVEGFSAIVDGRRSDEILAMPDNGYGGKANSRDFLIRAYYIRPDYKTASGGSGAVQVGQFIEFRDPFGVIGFPIVNEGTPGRLLTGGDIDPESLQRGRNGDFWMGDEFGPWILHFDSKGRLLDPPFADAGRAAVTEQPVPRRPAGDPTQQPRASRRWRSRRTASSCTRSLEGATVADTDQLRRYIYEFSIEDEAFTGRTWQYHVENTAHLVADMAALDRQSPRADRARRRPGPDGPVPQRLRDRPARRRRRRLRREGGRRRPDEDPRPEPGVAPRDPRRRPRTRRSVLGDVRVGRSDPSRRDTTAS